MPNDKNPKEHPETDDLIDSLCGNTKKTFPMCTWRCSIICLAATFAFFHFVLTQFGMRPDLKNFLSIPLCKVELYLALTAGIVAAMSASWLSMPDIKGRKWVYWAPIVPLIALLVVLVSRLITDVGNGNTTISDNWGDIPFILLFAAIPAIVFLSIIRRAATTHRIWTACMIALAASSLAYAAFRVKCEIMYTLDVIVWGLVPLTLVFIVIAFVGSKILKW